MRQEPKGNTISLGQLWGLFKAYKYFLTAILVVALTVGFILSQFNKPRYETNILLQVSNSGMGGLSGVSSLVQLASALPFVGKPQTATQTESVLIQSRFILGKVINQLHLNISAEPKYLPIFGHFFAAWHAYKHPDSLAQAPFGLHGYAWGGEKIAVDILHVAPMYTNQPFTLIYEGHGHYALKDYLGNTLLKNGQVGLIDKSAPIHPSVVIRVSAIQAHPGQQFTVTRHSVSYTLKHLISPSLSVTSYKQAQNILEVAYKSSSQHEVVNVLNAIAHTAYQQGIEAQTMKAARTLDFLNKQLPLAKASLRRSENALSNYETKHNNMDMATQYRLLLQQLMLMQQNIGQLQLKLADLLEKYTAHHPFVLTVKEKIATVARRIAHLKKRIKQLPQADKGEVQLLRDVKTKSQLYLMLLSRQQEMQVIKAGATSNLKILSYAAQPPIVLKTSKTLTVIGALIIGLLIDAIIVILLAAKRFGFLDPDSYELNFKAPILATLPYSDNQRKLIRHQKSKSDRYKDYVLARQFPSDVTVESLRSLRTSLNLMLAGKKDKSICIAGLTPGVGKSFVALNLAQVLSDTKDKKVLLIDVDMRRGHIAHFLNISNNHGLSDYLMGNARIEEIIAKTGDENLDFIPSHHARHNSADLLHGERFKALIDYANKHYDYVILDTAPILAVTDGTLVAKQASLTILALASGQHLMRELQRGTTVLNHANIDLSGVIFNFQERRSANAYGYNASYYYYYGNKKKNS